MKYILATNSKNTKPATFQDANQFRATFNKTIELPAFCQMCIVSSAVKDANDPKIHYVEITNLPLQATMGNGEKGGQPQILGPILSDEVVYGVKNWVDLNNPAPLVISDLYVKLTNQDGELSSGLSLQTEILIGYRAKGNTQQVS
tara:strand:+ start:49 stop:483 length:435 start_codon:yes stop_codon:yes gene_type:complete